MTYTSFDTGGGNIHRQPPSRPSTRAPQTPLKQPFTAATLPTSLKSATSTSSNSTIRTSKPSAPKTSPAANTPSTTPAIPSTQSTSPKLRADHPDIHSKIVHIRSCDAEKFLGRKYLYTCAKNAAGNRIHPYERTNLEDLRRHLGPAETAPYLLTRTKPLAPEILRTSEVRYPWCRGRGRGRWFLCVCWCGSHRG